MKLTKVSLSLLVVLLVLFSEMRSCKGQGINNETQEIRTCLEVFSLDVKPFAQSFLERVQRDLKDRVPENYIRELFCREDLNFNPQPMIKSLTWNEAKLPYHQFLEEGRIFRAKDFIEKNKELLQEIEKTFDVEKEIIVAIFLVETDLGRKRGVHQVFNTFFSLALAGEEELLKKYIDNNTLIELDNETMKNRLKRRANWAYNELLYFIEICYKNGWDPYSIRGSIFGAFGYSQFVPKSYLIYGYDWDGDGKVNLFEIPDALASIANYLKLEGYKSEADRSYKKKIIMKYNISEPYAETVLQIAEKLKN